MFREIRPLEPGSMIKFTVLDEGGRQLHMKLAVVATPDFKGRQEYGLAFVGECEGQPIICQGPYSGGTTGGGVHSWMFMSPIPTIRVITTELREIHRICGWKGGSSEKKD